MYHQGILLLGRISSCDLYHYQENAFEYLHTEAVWQFSSEASVIS